jgi:hypothetical protein
MENEWYASTERKPTDFKPWKTPLAFSGSLAGNLSYGVGRVRDRSEPAFSYMKLQVEDVDKRGNRTPIREYPLGAHSANCDLLAAIEKANETPRRVKLSKRHSVLVSMSKAGKVTLAFYDTPEGEKPRGTGAYEVAEKAVPHLVAHLKEATVRIASYLHRADADAKPRPAVEAEETFEPQAVHA